MSQSSGTLVVGDRTIIFHLIDFLYTYHHLFFNNFHKLSVHTKTLPKNCCRSDKIIVIVIVISKLAAELHGD